MFLSFCISISISDYLGGSLISGFFERDLVLEEDGPGEGSLVTLRGKLPCSFLFPSLPGCRIRVVFGSFINHTKICVPRRVVSLLSLGSKFMFPAFTHLSLYDREMKWEELRMKLINLGYPLQYMV